MSSACRSGILLVLGACYHGESMVRTLERLVYVLPVASMIALLALFNFFAPDSPGIIFVVFLLLYVFYASSFFVLLRGGIAFVGRFVARRKTVEPRQWRISVRRAYYVASVLAFAPVSVAGMQSLGQLQIRDAILLVVFEAIAIFYVIKRS